MKPISQTNCNFVICFVCFPIKNRFIYLKKSNNYWRWWLLKMVGICLWARMFTNFTFSDMSLSPGDSRIEEAVRQVSWGFEFCRSCKSYFQCDQVVKTRSISSMRFIGWLIGQFIYIYIKILLLICLFLHGFNIHFQVRSEAENAVIAPGSGGGVGGHTEGTHLFADRPRTANTINPEQAFVHMIKAMLGTGLLSLPLAFKHSGLYVKLLFS